MSNGQEKLFDKGKEGLSLRPVVQTNLSGHN
jgi:hypothetical protein